MVNALFDEMGVGAHCDAPNQKCRDKPSLARPELQNFVYWRNHE